MGLRQDALFLQVIFMFGEIDCREGLTMAVDKLKYETVDAAMDVLLTIYKGLRQERLCFASQKKLTCI